jgi:hypothetical protein
VQTRQEVIDFRLRHIQRGKRENGGSLGAARERLRR